MPATPRIDVRDENDTRVVSFKDKMVFDERTVRETYDQLAASLPNDGSPIRLVLDFTGVELISSTLLGKLILLQRRIDATGGKLRLTELGPTVAAVFRTSNLDKLFSIHRDVRTALDQKS